MMADSTVLDTARWEPHVGAVVPGSLAFTDEEGRAVHLADYRGKPVVLALVYLSCPALCPNLLNDTAHALAGVTTRDFTLLAASIDPKDTVAAAKARRQQFSGVDAHVLTGSLEAIQRLAMAVGFRYDCGAQGYAHPAGLVFLTPDGAVSGYLGGLGQTAAQVGGAIATARAAQPSGFQGALLRCYHALPLEGHSGTVLAALQAAGLATLAALAIGVARLLWKEPA